MWRWLILVVFLLSGCEKVEVLKRSDKMQPVEFEKGKVQCVVCTMRLKSKLFSAQAVMPDGKVYFFDDPGCMAMWYIKHKNTNATLWVFTEDTRRYVNAKEAWYRLGEATPMRYGFGVYEKRVEGSVDFEEFIEKMKRGENLRNPAIRAKLKERK